jgi:Delta7-sterol 5-desaturase
MAVAAASPVSVPSNTSAMLAEDSLWSSVIAPFYELPADGTYIGLSMDCVESSGTHAVVVVAFPGAAWLNRIESTDFKWLDVKYTSVYDALLQGNPLAVPCRNFNAYLNHWVLPPSVASKLVRGVAKVLGEGPMALTTSHYLLCYLRNLLAAMVVYYGTAGLFSWAIYGRPHSHATFEAVGRPRPSWTTMLHQVQTAQSSVFFYVMLTVVDEFVVEQGWTRVYYTWHEIGGVLPYLLYTVLYFIVVEFGIYWMHRTLHTNKFLYKHVHLPHHVYNKPETLTPWASIAFHPLDGILQCSPYVLTLFVVPCHYLTHFGMLFFTAIWATYIHDAMDFNFGVPNIIMGSKYHTMHHTHYIYNYGQVFTFFDWYYGTLRLPNEKKVD